MVAGNGKKYGKKTICPKSTDKKDTKMKAENKKTPQKYRLSHFLFIPLQLLLRLWRNW